MHKKTTYRWGDLNIELVKARLKIIYVDQRP
jgi:hypothetical protein